MTMISYRDQTNLFDPCTFMLPVHIIGMGSIGQAVFPLLLKFGISEFHLYDDDVASEPHNIPTQLLSGPTHTNVLKVEVCRQFAHEGWLEMGEDFIVHAHEEKATAETEFSGIVIAATDSMESRKEIWRAVQKNITAVNFYIDGRIGGLEYEFLSFPPAQYEHAKNYETFLVDSKYVSGHNCGARGAIHTPVVLACAIVENIRRFHLGIDYNVWSMKNLAE